VSEFVLTPAERALVEALDALGVRYVLVGMGAALLEGASGTTQDLDLWFGTGVPSIVWTIHSFPNPRTPRTHSSWVSRSTTSTTLGRSRS